MKQAIGDGMAPHLRSIRVSSAGPPGGRSLPGLPIESAFVFRSETSPGVSKHLVNSRMHGKVCSVISHLDITSGNEKNKDCSPNN